MRTKAAAANLAALTEQELPYLRRYARFLTRSQSQADDLVQDTLLRALERFHQFRPGTNLRAWLFTIMRNLYIGQMRKASRSLIPEVTHAIASSQQTKVALRQLAQAVAKLPAEQRETLLLVAVEGLTYAEAAEVIGVPVGTVRSRLSRARSALAPHLPD